ncbi:MAG: prenyltransferase, partial [Tateyamaria sp.]|nr:prenyltransferase [Tateyamaria sp.]
MFSEELLVVDLDGTLIKSDMLHESFWSAFSKNWLNLFFAMLALGRGKAALKEYL